MSATGKTISQVCEEFLSEQGSRLKPKTLAKYESIIGLFKTYLESYWPGQDEREYARITGDGGTFCDTFGPEKMIGGYSEFLGYFMPRKVMCGKETMQAAGTVTKKLAKWLADEGYVKDTTFAETLAGAAAKDLPAAQDVLQLLDAFVDSSAPDDYEDEIEDHFWVDRVEVGKLWLDPLTMYNGVIGPVPVPWEVTQVIQKMWDIGGVVVRTKQGWRFLDVWNVTPH